MSDDELSHINWTKRKKILDYAYHFVPFYKEKYQSAGMHPKDIKTRDDFEFIPILTKQEIRDNLEHMVSTNHDSSNLVLVSTGGSTGEPLKIYHDPNVKTDVFGWRMLEWWGVEPSENSALAYRAIPKGINKFLNSLMWFPTKRCFLDASFMSKDSIEKFLTKYNRNKTKLLIGYVGAIHALAMYINNNNIKISVPKAVWTTSAPLPEFQRKFLQDVFGAPVYSQYGSCETFWLAAECGKKNGMHMFSDTRHIEFVNSNGRGVGDNEYGNILVTDLENYACPIIRYENGDRGRSLNEKCDCGINLPLMDSVKGRESDSVIMPNGDIISGEFLTTVFDDFPDVVRAFQVKQSKDFAIELLYVLADNVPDLNAVNIVRDRILKMSSSQVPVKLIKVDDIPHVSGKSKFIISEVKSNLIQR